MTSTTSTTTAAGRALTDRVDLQRRVPPFGGFNLTYLGIELKRRLRNRRTLIFTIAFPVVMFVIIGLPLGWGLYQSVQKARPLFSGTMTRPAEAPKK